MQQLHHSASSSPASEDARARLAHAIEHAAHLLPAQGPITVFIHHNTLHAFEDLTFDQGVQKGARIFDCHPYLPEERYREYLVRGRIRLPELAAVLQEDLGARGQEPILSLGTRLALRLAMLQYPLRFAPDPELRWFVAETDALRKVRPEVSPESRKRLIETTQHWIMRDVRQRNGSSGRTRRQEERIHQILATLFQQFGESEIENWNDEKWEAFALQALWRVCRDGVRELPFFDPPPPFAVRHRDLLKQATGVDIDPLVNEVLIRFCAAFLDQGFAHWHLPEREQGFYHAFCRLYREPLGPPDPWLHGLAAEIARLEESGMGPLESIQESLDLLGIPEDEWDEFLSATVLVLRGWAGMIQQIEIRGDRVAHPAPKGSVVEFLAVRLILVRLALAHAAQTSLAYDGPLNKVREAAKERIEARGNPSIEQRAFLVFQLAQVLGWLPDQLFRLRSDEWSKLIEEVEAFSGLERRRILHSAFERRFETRFLDAVSLNSRRTTERIPSPRFQVMCCLDEREESFRRHLEEIAPDVETFGAAGFYSVAMYYRGTADAHFVPLCPIVIQPQHWVAENVLYSLDEMNRRRAKTRRALGTASHQMHVGSRSIAGGALLTAGLGVLASVPLVARILFPRLTARIRATVSRFVQPPQLTQLQLERTDPKPGPEPSHIGFTVEEMANNGERLLRDIGLISGFSRLVIILGHGSNSLNNPHNSAYNCGACGGSAGGPNARASAQILNDPRVRDILARRGLPLPNETVFVGGFHNTCNDEVTLLDVDFVPPSHWEELAAAQAILDQTCERNAHERCRRFESAPLTLSLSAAKRHVEERSEDLSQARPECGHASNAICIVGRRSRTQGLFLDRRAFLTSYDPTQDDAESSILARTMGAIFPVCGGINLEYYFSYIDSVGWGCGTKLPHNVSALLGVMDGAASDLRTGLPWQMVEIHEPVRLQLMVETTPERMLRVLEQNKMGRDLSMNGWVALSVLDPYSNQIHVMRNGKFEVYQPQETELKQAASSADWYRGWRDNLEFAQINPDLVKRSPAVNGK